MNTEPITVYWAPFFTGHVDLTQTYCRVETLSDVANRMNISESVHPRDNFLNCPAAADLFRHTLVVRNLVNTKVSIDGEEVVYENPSSKYQKDVKFMRPPHIDNRLNLYYDHTVIFFSSESLDATVTTPFFERSVSSQYGLPFPGRFDIGRWFRPINAEFLLYPGVKALHIPSGDPLFYVSLGTNRPILLKQFVMTEELIRISYGLMKASPFKLFARMSLRYEKFEEMKMHKNIIRLIHQKLLE